MKKLILIALLLISSSWAYAVAVITNVDFHSARQIAVTYSEAVDPVKAVVAKYYILSGTGKGSLGSYPTSVALDSGNTYILTWAAGEMFHGGLLTIKSVFLNSTYTGAATAQGVAPILTNFVVTGTRSAIVTFNEKMKDPTTVANYVLSGAGLGTIPTRPSASTLVSGFQYRLTWTTGEFVRNQSVTVVANVKDAAGNLNTTSLSASTGEFSTNPVYTKVLTSGPRTIDVYFSETMKLDGGVLTASNYTVSGLGAGTLASNPTSVALVKAPIYRLTWSSGEMLTGSDVTVAVAPVQDLVGNSTASASKTHLKGGKGVPPTIVNFEAKDTNVIDVYLSEPLGVGATTPTSFVLGNTGRGTLTANPTSVTVFNGSGYRLTWATGAMVAAGNLTVTIKLCKDVIGNLCNNAKTISYVGYGTDPFFADQWHLSNTGQLSGTSGEDINVLPVWNGCDDNSCRGEGVRIAVVDDGMELTHEDLRQNVVVNGSYNYLTRKSSLAYSSTDKVGGHGHACAGIIAARDYNKFGVRGVAPRASLVAYNYLKKGTGANLIDAMTRNASLVSISSNSWGPADGYNEYAASDSIFKNAVTTGLTSGRGGLGTIYVWAAGNGFTGSSDCPSCVDNSNHDGYANYRGVVAVGAVNNLGEKSSYSEWGANLWVSAPGGEFCNTNAITTTDRTGAIGINTNSASDYTNRNYTKCMNGTSAATPVVSGVIALMLQAKPTLGWRDVRYILAKTARQNDAGDSGWFTNGGSVKFNHLYGFGVVDAEAAVDMAASYGSNFGTEVTHTVGPVTAGDSIPDNNTTGVSKNISVSSSGITDVEWVELTLSAANHTFSGDLKVTLTSPSGTVSTLAVPHNCFNNACDVYSNWIFSSAAFLDEGANGTWVLKVSDEALQDSGTLQNYTLKIYGH